MVVMERTMTKPGNGNGHGRGPTRAWKTAFAGAILIVGLFLIVADSLGYADPPYEYVLPLLFLPASWIFGVTLRELLGRGDS